MQTTLEKIIAKFKGIKNHSFQQTGNTIWLRDRKNFYRFIINTGKDLSKDDKEFAQDLLAIGNENGYYFVAIITEKDYQEYIDLINAKNWNLLSQYCKASHKKYKLI